MAADEKGNGQSSDQADDEARDLAGGNPAGSRPGIYRDRDPVHDPDNTPEQTRDRRGDVEDTSPAETDDTAAGGHDSSNPAAVEPPFSVAFGDGGTLVDRDEAGGTDDGERSRRQFVDSDYADDFPGIPGADDEDDEPDAGYAAFADELDDPLADWPTPEAELGSLPEMRSRGSAEADRGVEDDPFAGPTASGYDEKSRSDRPDRAFRDPSDDFYDEHPEAAFFDDPVDPDPQNDFSATAPRDSRSATPDVDRDEPARVPRDPPVGATTGASGGDPEGRRDDDRSDIPDLPLPGVTELPEPPDIKDADEDAYGSFDDPPPAPDEDFPGSSPADHLARPDEADDDAFIDDFLNDLDAPGEDERGGARTQPVSPEVVDNPYGDPPVTSPVGDGERESVARFGAGVLEKEDGEAERPPMSDYGRDTVLTSADDEDSGLPWGLIAVVVIALVLLAAGGFGVVQQRSTLKAEIRDLQAQLATAVAPEEAAAERERQRQIELENESLAAELAALEAENTALAGQLDSLETQLEEQLGAQETAVQEAAEAASRQAARAASEPAAPARSAPAPETVSGWFVNFGSYAQENIARRWADRLEVSSGRVVVQEAQASGRTLYRVRVVGLPTQDAAERVATTLERQHQLPRLWVGRS